MLRRHRADFRVVRWPPAGTPSCSSGNGPSSACRPIWRAPRPDDPAVLAELAAHPDADVVLNAVVGFAGLPATLAALEAGKRLALANKESLIAGGPIVAKARAAGGGEIVPVDSEHSAVWQALRAGKHGRGRAHRAHRERRAVPRPHARPSSQHVQPADALAHPTWNMGAKITIDSSTLMNKGLEVIEAHELFGVDFDAIDVVVHPQSVVHGMVEFVDGATDRAALDARHAPADRPRAGRTRPVARGLRRDRLDDALDAHVRAARPCRPSGRSTSPTRPAATGGTAPAVLSARERGRGRGVPRPAASAWPEIAETVAEVLDQGTGNAEEVADVLDADRVARERAAAVDRTTGADR